MLHLTYEERIKIQAYLKENHSFRKIWRLLLRDHTVISREVNSNWGREKYNPWIANVKSKTRRALVNAMIHCKIKRWWELENYILDWLWNYWSPEEIAWARNMWEHDEKISGNIIRRFIKYEYPELKKKLRRWGKPYKWCTEAANYIYWRVSIRERTKGYKNEFGHREIDTMRWPEYKRWFITLTEIKSKLQLIHLIHGKDAVKVQRWIEEMIERIPEELRKTIAFDNWKEFIYHYVLKEKYDIKTYFCDPGNPRQRWLNENTNGLNRQFAPKWWNWKTKEHAPKDWNWEEISEEYVNKIEKLINNRPRKTLWYLSPIQYLENNWIKLNNN